MLNNLPKITNNSKLFALLHKVTDKINFCADYDILALTFDVGNLEEIPHAVELLKNFLKQNNLPPLMICASGKDDIDKFLLPELIKILDRECIISFVTEKTYREILPEVIKGNHYVVLKTPIDINLAKELNILACEAGVSRDKIIMNTDIGGLGYGFEYGYSIIEKIKLETDDEYLNLPIISEAPLESLKTKEAKYNDKQRTNMIELTSASGVLAAGANIIVMTDIENIKIMKGMC